MHQMSTAGAIFVLILVGSVCLVLIAFMAWMVREWLETQKQIKETELRMVEALPEAVADIKALFNSDRDNELVDLIMRFLERELTSLDYQSQSRLLEKEIELKRQLVERARLSEKEAASVAAMAISKAEEQFAEELE